MLGGGWHFSQFMSIEKMSPWELVVVIPSALRGKKEKILGRIMMILNV